jgi:hypothetical protein
MINEKQELEAYLQMKFPCDDFFAKSSTLVDDSLNRMFLLVARHYLYFGKKTFQGETPSHRKNRIQKAENALFYLMAIPESDAKFLGIDDPKPSQKYPFFYTAKEDMGDFQRTAPFPDSKNPDLYKVLLPNGWGLLAFRFLYGFCSKKFDAISGSNADFRKNKQLLIYSYFDSKNRDRILALVKQTAKENPETSEAKPIEPNKQTPEALAKAQFEKTEMELFEQWDAKKPVSPNALPRFASKIGIGERGYGSGFMKNFYGNPEGFTSRACFSELLISQALAAGRIDDKDYVFEFSFDFLDRLERAIPFQKCKSNNRHHAAIGPALWEFAHLWIADVRQRRDVSRPGEKTFVPAEFHPHFLSRALLEKEMGASTIPSFHAKNVIEEAEANEGKVMPLFRIAGEPSDYKEAIVVRLAAESEEKTGAWISDSMEGGKQSQRLCFRDNGDWKVQGSDDEKTILSQIGDKIKEYEEDNDEIASILGQEKRLRAAVDDAFSSSLPRKSDTLAKSIAKKNDEIAKWIEKRNKAGDELAKLKGEIAKKENAPKAGETKPDEGIAESSKPSKGGDDEAAKTAIEAKLKKAQDKIEQLDKDKTDRISEFHLLWSATGEHLEEYQKVFESKKKIIEELKTDKAPKLICNEDYDFVDRVKNHAEDVDSEGQEIELQIELYKKNLADYAAQIDALRGPIENGDSTKKA